MVSPLAPPVVSPLAPPVAPPLAPGVPGSASLGVYTQAIASCSLSPGGGDLVRPPAACGPEVSAKSGLASPPPELPEPAP